MSLADKIKSQEDQARKEGISSAGGGWVKLQEGDNRFRVLSEPEMIFEDYKLGICYTDCGFEGGAKFLMYVLDRKDGKVKIWKAPYTVGTAIANYEKDEEYAFEGYPMPYDVKLNAIGAGTKEVKYTLTPGRAETPLNDDVRDQLSKKKPMLEIIQGMKEKNKAEHVADGTWESMQAHKKEVKEHIEGALKENGEKAEGVQYPGEEINPEDIPF